ncbi:MAG: hypothetical protein ACOX8W_06330 [bacterium]|jgi:hypothetical protein
MFMNFLYLCILISAAGGIVAVQKNKTAPFVYASLPLGILLAGLVVSKLITLVVLVLPILLSPLAGGASFLLANIKYLTFTLVGILIALVAYRALKERIPGKLSLREDKK